MYYVYLSCSKPVNLGFKQITMVLYLNLVQILICNVLNKMYHHSGHIFNVYSWDPHRQPVITFYVSELLIGLSDQKVQKQLQRMNNMYNVGEICKFGE